MIAEVERRIEGSLVEKLKAEIARLSEALEVEEESKSKTDLQKQYVQKEIRKLEEVLAVLMLIEPKRTTGPK